MPLCCRDVVELQSRLAYVEFRNKKLLDELSMRNHQLEASDELNTQFSVQIDSLNADIKSYVNVSWKYLIVKFVVCVIWIIDDAIRSFIFR